jgi:mono/diheme cytochrome c family protein
MKLLTAAFALIGLAATLGAAFTYAGYYDVAADDPHWDVTRGFIASARDRSIARQSREVGKPPALDDPALLALGAGHYNEMCVDCHLAPGMGENEIRPGLNPKPPKLAVPGASRTPEGDFWVIKHGIKMTAMPAWGMTHDDHIIWGMVAFLQKLPGLSRADYDALVAKSGPGGHSHEDDEHEHDDGAEAAHDHANEDSDHRHGG